MPHVSVSLSLADVVPVLRQFLMASAAAFLAVFVLGAIVGLLMARRLREESWRR